MEKSTVYINSSSPPFRTDTFSLPLRAPSSGNSQYLRYIDACPWSSPPQKGEIKITLPQYSPPYSLTPLKKRQQTHLPDAASQVQTPPVSRHRRPAAHHDEKTSRSYQQTEPPEYRRSPSSQSSAPCSSCRPAPRRRPSPRRSAAAWAASGSRQTRPCWPRAGA
jgi:hypothetical protein